MTRFLLDTNIVSDVLKRPTGSASRRLATAAGHEVAVNPIIAGELWFGFEKRPNAKLEGRLESFFLRTQLLPIEEGVERRYGRVRAVLEAEGRRIGENDLWIAAHALALDATLVTANEREFRRVKGLVVENWLAGG